MNLDIEKGHSLDELILSFSETFAWCSSRPKPWNALRTFRSPEIAPEFGSNSEKDWVDSVIWQRRHILGGKIAPPQNTFRGKLLVFFLMKALIMDLKSTKQKAT